MSQSFAPILDESFSLTKETLLIVSRMPKAYRFSLGLEISKKCLEIFSSVSSITTKISIDQKLTLVQKIQSDTTLLSNLYRLAHQLKLISEGVYPKICLHSNEIYSQAIALEKWALKNLHES
jgi:hypothetical protein